MTKSSNKKLGNDFEAELCSILFEHGFWVHNMAQNASGQPADIIAVRNGRAYLIDCKVCSGGKFDLRRVEENQESAMELWKDRGNGVGWFALKLDEQVFMLSHHIVRFLKACQPSISEAEIRELGGSLEQWLQWVTFRP